MRRRHNLKQYWLLAVIGLWMLLHLLMRPRGKGRRPVVIAHRGAAALAPENTLAAIRAGRHTGAGFIEVDVQRTKDGVLVLMHDRTVDRTTDGRGQVDGMTLAQIQELDAGSWFDPRFAGEPVPTLNQVLPELEGWEGTLVVEAKHPDAHPALASDLNAALQQYPAARFTFVSFNAQWLDRFEAEDPNASLGALSLYPFDLTPKADIQRVGVFWLAPILDPTLVARAHERGLDLWVWTVDHPWLMRALAWLGVDGITSNDPELALDILTR